MNTKNIISFIPNSVTVGYQVTVDGVCFGYILASGWVIKNGNVIVDHLPITGLAKLLNVSIEEATAIFNRESLSAIQATKLEGSK